jgi:hypothetical protein
LLTVVPGVASERTIAWMVMVTELPPGMEPFQVTVFVAVVATAVPLLAVAETRVSDDGSTSMSSSPGLSCCAIEPLFESTIV